MILRASATSAPLREIPTPPQAQSPKPKASPKVTSIRPMSVSITKENFFWHKLHSLAGIVPIGFYMLQHLVLNTFSLAGPDYFNGVIGFFEGMPFHFLLIL